MDLKDGVMTNKNYGKESVKIQVQCNLLLILYLMKFYLPLLKCR